MIGTGAIISVCAAVALTLSPPAQAQAESMGGNHVTQFPPHPGTIRTISEYDGSVEMTKADDASDGIKFVYLDKNGIEVDSAEAASERIPIVEVRIISTDGNGNPVPRDKAKLIRLLEYGPGGRLLRSATMVPN
jgi:hypothetical protein